ncbi:MAG: hypothetical protein E6K70_24605 [Planctomycetota bacterium]|nr:MAG: hypothetical protein E6K70_24605 [Planctomycetota bacterium]
MQAGKRKDVFGDLEHGDGIDRLAVFFHLLGLVNQRLGAAAQGVPNLVDLLALGKIAFQGHQPASRLSEILALNRVLGMRGQEPSHQVERGAPVLGVRMDAQLVNLDVLQFRAQGVQQVVPFIPLAYAAQPGRFVEANDRGQNFLRRLEHLQARQILLAVLRFALETAGQEVIDLAQGDTFVVVDAGKLSAQVRVRPIDLPLVVEDLQRDPARELRVIAHVLGDGLHDEDLVAPPHGHDIVGNGQRLEKLTDQRILALLGLALQIGGLPRLALGCRLIVVIFIADAQWGFAFALA